MSADLRLQAAREFLTAARKHRVGELPPSLLVREDAELRRQLGQVLDNIGRGYVLDGEQASLVPDALEVAGEYRRYRADLACDACARSAAGACDSHAADVERVAEYDDLAEPIREAWR